MTPEQYAASEARYAAKLARLRKSASPSQAEAWDRFMWEWDAAQRRRQRLLKASRRTLVKAQASATSGVDSAYREIERRADRLVAKDAKISKDAAVARVLKEHPELYAAYEREFFELQQVAAQVEVASLARINKQAAGRS